MDLSKIFLEEPMVIAVEPRQINDIKELIINNAIAKETRDESFEIVKETLGERQRIVLDQLETVFTDGATAKELSNHLYRQGLAPSPERNSVHPRLNELISKGLVEVIGKKTCQFTNRKVAVYKSKK